MDQQYQVFLSYAQDNVDQVEEIAKRLKGDGHLDFWFAPWHNVPGLEFQEQAEDALDQSACCAIFVGGGAEQIEGWQNEEMRAAIALHVEENRRYRVLPVFLPGTTRVSRRDLPRFLRNYFRPGLEVAFDTLEDERAYKRLLAGILGKPPIEIEGYLTAKGDALKIPEPPPPEGFASAHALVIGVADYPHYISLPETIHHDAGDLYALLTDPAACGYPADQVTKLLDAEASGDGIRAALKDLSARAGADDTAVIYFSGHGAHKTEGGTARQYLLPHDYDPADHAGTALSGDEISDALAEIEAARLLVLFDSCHSGGAAIVKGDEPEFERGLDEGYYEALAQGTGRVVMASSRAEEQSYALRDMRNSLFTHYLLEALRGKGPHLGDGRVRVFDVFRHVSKRVPERVKSRQHPIFKATAMEEDFPIALVP
jgi:hypothetical protein